MKQKYYVSFGMTACWFWSLALYVRGENWYFAAYAALFNLFAYCTILIVEAIEKQK